MMQSLLSMTQGLIERTYRTATGVDDIARFIIGDRGYRLFSERHLIVRRVEEKPAADSRNAAGAAGPQVLVRPVEGGMALAVYFPDDLIGRLEHRPPTRTLDGHNVDDFAAFVEEIDHFVLLAHGLAHDREITLLEMEIRANVSKALVLSHFIGRLARRACLEPAERRWLRFHLFEKHRFVEEDEQVRRRYEEARRFAVRILDRLAELPAEIGLRALRRWNALPAQLKLRQELAGVGLV